MILAAALILGGTYLPFITDKQVAQDKQLHAIMGATAGFSADFGARLVKPGSFFHERAVAAIGTCTVVGVGKEMIDFTRNGNFGFDDLAADGVGCVIGGLVGEGLGATFIPRPEPHGASVAVVIRF